MRIKSIRRGIIAIMSVVLLLLAGCGNSTSAPAEVRTPPAFTGEVSQPTQTVPATSAPAATEQQATAQPDEGVPAKIYLNGNRLELEKGAYSVDGEVFVPMTEVMLFFSRGFETTVDGEKLSAISTDGATTIDVTAGSTSVMLNGSSYQLSFAPVLYQENGQVDMFVEVSSFVAFFGAEVRYNDGITIVYVTEPNLC